MKGKSNCQPRKRRCSYRQLRKTENFEALIEVIHSDDIDEIFGNVVPALIEPALSAFSQLFTDREKMEIWNNFIESSEEEQEQLICSNSSATDVDMTDFEDLSCSDEKDKRETHPAYSAEKCFSRIDNRLREMLRKRHVPKGKLASMEDALITFFTAWPTAVYVSMIECGYERLLMHALCQYLNLLSRSYDFEGKRHTEVQNPADTFIAPQKSICEYLDQLTLSR